jgi:hypothetical protein
MPNRLRPLAPLALALAVFGCKNDEEVKTLFDENGAWTLVEYDLGDGTFSEVVENGRDGFLLSFAKSENVVTAATCGMDGENEPSNSLCGLTPEDAPFVCRCFSYAFEDDQMAWREFPPGSTPPPPPELTGGGGEVGALTTDAGGTADGGGDAGDTGGGSGDTLITVGEVAEVANSYTFRPLPLGLFESDGATSRFKFEARGSSLFENLVFGGEEGHPSCPARCVPGG